MKTTLTLTAFLLSATAALAGPTENITGCATAPVEGANYTVRADVTCALSTDQNDGSGLLLGVAFSPFLPEIDEDAE